MNAVTQPPRGDSARALSNAEIAAEVLHGVQLNRAMTMALTRLQVAMAGRNRRAALEALDRLHALDGQAETLAARLPALPGDEEAEAVARHLVDQKLAIAFEKLALASAISGPDMVSAPATPAEDLLILDQPLVLAEAAGEEPEDHAPPPLADWPALPLVEPTEWRPRLPLALRATIALGLLAALLGLMALLLMAAV